MPRRFKNKSRGALATALISVWLSGARLLCKLGILSMISNAGWSLMSAVISPPRVQQPLADNYDLAALPYRSSLQADSVARDGEKVRYYAALPNWALRQHSSIWR